MVEIGKLTRVPLNEIWKHEALDFTPWLADNIEVLGEALNLKDLRVVEREKTVGSFSLDILGEDASGAPVIIENQIYKTDHDHLGKVLVYLTNLNAKTAIWITSDARPEHIRAMSWLNEASPQDIAFYLVRVEAYRIGNSPAAPVFSRIVEPSVEQKEIGKQKEDLAQRYVDRLEFWRGLIERANASNALVGNLSPTKDNWINASKFGTVALSYVIRMSDAEVSLYIERAGSRELNKALFDRLYSQKDAIESEFRAPLSWQRLDNRDASRIAYQMPGGGLQDRDRWPEIQDAMISGMTRLRDAILERTRLAILDLKLATQASE